MDSWAGAGSVWTGCCGAGQQSERDGLCKGVPTALNRTAAEQEHNIRRRTSMQLGETHIPVCHDKQRLCVDAFLLQLLSDVWFFGLGSKNSKYK